MRFVDTEPWFYDQKPICDRGHNLLSYNEKENVRLEHLLTPRKTLMDPFYVALMLYFAAIVLAFVDLFVPSGGLLVIVAALGGIAAVLFAFRSGNTAGMAMLTLVIASVPVFAFLAIRIWPHTPMGRRIILKLPESTTVAQGIDEDPLRELVGHVFQVEAAFLPTGQLRVGHQRFNASAESGFIEAGAHVKVIAVRERNLIVRQTTEPLTARETGPGQSAANEDNGQTSGSLLDRPAAELGLDSLDN